MTTRTNSLMPFIKSDQTRATLLTDICIAALPIAAWSIYVWGARSAVILTLSVAVACAANYLVGALILKNHRYLEPSAVVTGFLIAFAMPVSVPLWLPCFAALVAEGVVKQLFGGLGKNIFNPAAAGICASVVTFPSLMTSFTKPFAALPAFSLSIPAEKLDSVRVLTALDTMREGVVETNLIGDNLYGLAPGTIGDISAVLILLAFVYLLTRGAVRFSPAFAYIVTIMVLTFFTAYADSEPVDFAVMQIVAGPAMLVSVFFVADYTTTPQTIAGRVVFAVLCAALSVGIRYYGMIYYGEYFAVLILNMLTPALERGTAPRIFGSHIVKEDINV